MSILVVGYGTTSHNAITAQNFDFSTLTDISGSGGVTLQQDDMVVVALAHSGTGTRTLAQMTPTGYTSVTAAIVTSSDTDVLTLGAFYKFMGASPDANVSIPACGAATNSISAVVYVFRNVNTGTPLAGVTPTTVTAINGTLPNPPSITTAASPTGQVIVGVMGQAQATGAALTAPTTTPYDATANYVKASNNTAQTNDSALLVGIKTGVAVNTAFDASAATGGTTANTDASGAISFVLNRKTAFTQAVAAVSTPVVTAPKALTLARARMSITSTLVATVTWVMIWARTVAAIGTPAMAITRMLNKALSVSTDRKITNSYLWSEDFTNAVWGSTALTITADATAAPDGNVTADLLVPTTANTLHALAQLINGAPGDVFSIYAKPAGYTKVRFAMLGFDGSAIYVDVSNGTVLTQFGSGVYFENLVVEAAANGFYRISFSAAASYIGNEVRISVIDAGGNEFFIGDGVSGLYLWGAQYELNAGPHAHTYVKTTTAETTGASMSTTSIARAVAKVLAITSTPVGLIVKAVAQAHAITSTPVAAIAKALTLARSNLNITSTPVPAIVRSVAKIVSAASTGAAAIIRSEAKAVSVTGTPVAAVQRSVVYVLSIASTPVPALLRTLAFARTAFAIASTPIAQVLRQIPKMLEVATGGSVTNNYLQSEDFTSASWSKGAGASITADATTAPDGNATADKLIETATNTVHGVSQGTQNAGDSVAFYVKAGERTKVRIDMSNADGSAIVFDLSAGTLNPIAGSARFFRDWFIEAASITIPGAGAGWYRIGAAVRPNSSTVHLNLVTAINTASYAGDGASGAYVWGAQWQKSYEGFGAYVATTSAAVSVVTALATISRSISKIVAITTTPIAAIVRAIASIRGVTSTPVPSLTRTYSFVRTTLTIITSPVATLAKVLVFIRTLAATTTPVAAIARSAGKPISAATTPEPSLLRSTGRIVSSITTAIPSMVRNVGRVISAVSTPVATMVRSAQKIIATASTPIPVLSRIAAQARTLSIASTPIPSVLRSIALSARNVTSTPAATIQRSVAKAVAVTITSVPALLRSVGKALSVASTPVAALQRLVARTLGSSTIPVPALDRIVGKPIAASSTGGASLVRQVGKIIAAASTGIASLTATLQAGTRTYTQVLSVAAQPVASIARQLARRIEASAAGVAAMSRQLGRSIGATVTGIATLVRIRTARRSLDASSTVSATVARRQALLRQLSAVTIPVPALARTLNRLIASSIDAAASIRRTVTKTLSIVSIGVGSLPSFGRPVVISAVATGVASVVTRLVRYVRSLLRLDEVPVILRADSVELMDRSGEADLLERLDDAETPARGAVAEVAPARGDAVPVMDRSGEAVPAVRRSDV